jgi:hypothetical protein
VVVSEMMGRYKYGEIELPCPAYTLISQSLASILFKAPANPARYESSEGEGGDDDDNDDEDDEEASDFDEAEGEEEADGKADGEGDGTRQSFSFSSNPYSSTIILHPNSPC